MRRIFLALAALFLVACGSGPQCSAGMCSDAKGVCQLGTQASACGGSGTCAVCAGADLCSASQRVCGPCGPKNCSGCCTSDGRCNVEIRDRDTACGFNGAACVDCTASAKVCSTTSLGCQ